MTQNEITKLSPECMADLCFRLHELFYPLVSISKIETNQEKLTNNLRTIFNQTIIDTIVNLGAKDKEDLISNICGIAGNDSFSDVNFHKLLHLQLGIYGVTIPQKAIKQITGEQRFELNSQLVELLQPTKDRLRSRIVVLSNDDLSIEFKLSGYSKDTEFELGLDGVIYKIHQDRINIDKVIESALSPILDPLGILQEKRFGFSKANDPTHGTVRYHLRKSSEVNMLSQIDVSDEKKDLRKHIGNLAKASSRFIVHYTDVKRILEKITEIGLESYVIKSFTPQAVLEDPQNSKTVVPIGNERPKE